MQKAEATTPLNEYETVICLLVMGGSNECAANSLDVCTKTIESKK